MSKKKRKKKIKRTPNQLKKIRQRQMECEERNRQKRKLKIQMIQKEFENQMLEIKNQLTEEDKKDMWFHLTTPYRYEKIKEEGLKGGVNGKHSEDKGFLYMVDTDCKKVWNGLGVFHINQHNEDDIESGIGKKPTKMEGLREMMGRDKKPYIVLGIPKKVFEIMGCPLSEDLCSDLTNYNQNHRRVQLGNRVIHPSLLKVVYEGISDMWKYETKDRWEFQQKFYKRKFGKWIPKFLLTIEDGILGDIRYSERKKKNSINFLKQTDEQLETYCRNRIRTMTMTNSIHLKPSNEQSGELILNNRTTY